MNDNDTLAEVVFPRIRHNELSDSMFSKGDEVWYEGVRRKVDTPVIETRTTRVCELENRESGEVITGGCALDLNPVCVSLLPSPAPVPPTPPPIDYPTPPSTHPPTHPLPTKVKGAEEILLIKENHEYVPDEEGEEGENKEGGEEGEVKEEGETTQPPQPLQPPPPDGDDGAGGGGADGGAGAGGAGGGRMKGGLKVGHHGHNSMYYNVEEEEEAEFDMTVGTRVRFQDNPYVVKV